MSEKTITFRYNELTLSGTFSVPDKGDRFPAVLLIPGSGQVDRDENHPKMKLNVFAELTGFLLEKGFAVLRYDKIGVGESEGDYFDTGFLENIEAAAAAVDFLKQQEGVDANKVFLLGHSEGAFIATRLAAQDPGNTAGIILLSGAAHSGEETLKWQALQVVEGMTGFNKWLINFFHIDVAKSQQKQLDKIKRTTKNSIRIQLARLNAKWMREFLVYDPAEDFPKITVPVLAITGSKDIQVPADDLKDMESMLSAPYEYHILTNVTHLLRADEGKASINNYKKLLEKPLDPGIPELILNWLVKQS